MEEMLIENLKLNLIAEKNLYFRVLITKHMRKRKEREYERAYKNYYCSGWCTMRMLINALVRSPSL
jgi:hypothetical protein